jgi:hypothetical protein
MIFDYIGENKIRINLEGELTQEDLDFLVNGSEDDINYMKKMSILEPIENGAKSVLEKILNLEFNSYSLDLDVDESQSLIITFNNLAYVSDGFYDKSKNYSKLFSEAGLIPRTPFEMVEDLGWEFLGTNKSVNLENKIIIVKDQEGIKREYSIMDIMDIYYKRFANINK